MPQVFVSYTGSDAAAALPIIEAIRRAGLNVSHTDADTLESACIMVLWSRATAHSHFAPLRIRQAIQAWSSGRLVLVALDDTPLPAGLRDLSTIAIGDASELGTQQLIEQVRRLTERPGLFSARTGMLAEELGPFPPSIFVSYSHQDGQTVEHLIQQIEQLGYRVWIDRAMAGPQRYAGQIVHAIRSSRLVALMCSQNAFTSDHVICEVYVAGDLKKPFVIFELDSTEFPDEILYFDSGFPRLPVATMDSQRLHSEIARLVAGRPPAGRVRWPTV